MVYLITHQNSNGPLKESIFHCQKDGCSVEESKHIYIFYSIYFCMTNTIIRNDTLVHVLQVRPQCLSRRRLELVLCYFYFCFHFIVLICLFVWYYCFIFSFDFTMVRAPSAFHWQLSLVCRVSNV